MAVAAYNATISIATAATGAGAYDEFTGVLDFTIGDSSDILDKTAFSDGRFRRKLVGLADISVSLSGDLDHSATAYRTLRAAYSAGNEVGVMIKYDGTNGVVYGMVVSQIERSASVDGKVEFSITLEHSGASTPFDIGSGL